MAGKVGLPGRSNCGTCHWYGGGGNNVKHGDMDSALADPSRDHDVHMGGCDFTCQECHYTENHKIAGRSTTSSVSEGSVACTDCHSPRPHQPDAGLQMQLNDHGAAIACETCHIPEYAKESMTTMLWDWSKSGGKDKVLEKTDKMKKLISKNKGLLIKEKNLKPSYDWYNGIHKRYLKGDQVNMKGVTYLNHPRGSINDPKAKITPYKLMTGIVPADAEKGYLVVPKLFGSDGYFKHFNWEKAARDGMAEACLDFSGKVSFVETIMHWRLTHGVAPKEKALSCLSCHGRDSVMDFEKLGYKGDPAVIGGRKCTP